MQPSDQLSEKTIAVERSLRYYTREPLSKEQVHLVYLFHGYGQLAYYFLRKVADLLPENVLFVAPEGMHRFYLNGTSGRVGASWMTRELRETDIQENTAALDKLHASLIERYKPLSTSVIGFSQGGATAARWVANGKTDTDLFVSWASVFPPDITFPENQKLGKSNVFVIGKEDEFFPEPERLKAMDHYTSMGFEIRLFNGGHDLHAPTLLNLLS